MNFVKYEFHRHSIRLKGYDYSNSGAYFITICTNHRAILLGEIINYQVQLNDIGKMIQKTWIEIPITYPDVELDEFIVMPDHLHGIVIINSNKNENINFDIDNEKTNQGQIQGFETNLKGQTQGFAPTLPEIVKRFKTLTTKKYIDGIKQYNWKPFDKRLWQRNYYEHIIRSDKYLHKIREYIINNPCGGDGGRGKPPCLP